MIKDILQGKFGATFFSISKTLAREYKNPEA
jgi:hypothetical protein